MKRSGTYNSNNNTVATRPFYNARPISYLYYKVLCTHCVAVDTKSNSCARGGVVVPPTDGLAAGIYRRHSISVVETPCFVKATGGRERRRIALIRGNSVAFGS